MKHSARVWLGVGVASLLASTLLLIGGGGVMWGHELDPERTAARLCADDAGNCAAEVMARSGADVAERWFVGAGVAFVVSVVGLCQYARLRDQRIAGFSPR